MQLYRLSVLGNCPERCFADKVIAGADTGFWGHIGMGMGACPSKLARVSGKAQ